MARATIGTAVRIHPPELLDRLDAQARKRGLSRNEWIVRALTKAVERAEASAS